MSKKFNSNVTVRKDDEATFLITCPDFWEAERVISLFSELKKKIIRDKAYTFLKEAYDEVRACGKYVFADDPDRLKRIL